jgi:hypothetical protein
VADGLNLVADATDEDKEHVGVVNTHLKVYIEEFE